MKAMISVKEEINVPVQKAWILWTTPVHITKWNSASDDWHTPSASIYLKEGGRFSYRMEARDGSEGFDFEGTFTQIKEFQLIRFRLSDERMVSVYFTEAGQKTLISEDFEAEDMNPHELQQQGWQAILSRFRQYAESFNS